MDLPKSKILALISEAIDKAESFEGNWELRNTPYRIKVNLEFEEPDSFTDSYGVTWIRDTSKKEEKDEHKD